MKAIMEEYGGILLEGAVMLMLMGTFFAGISLSSQTTLARSQDAVFGAQGVLQEGTFEGAGETPRVTLLSGNEIHVQLKRGVVPKGKDFEMTELFEAKNESGKIENIRLLSVTDAEGANAFAVDGAVKKRFRDGKPTLVFCRSGLYTVTVKAGNAKVGVKRSFDIFVASGEAR